jgi:serine/threonine-protein kinase
MAMPRRTNRKAGEAFGNWTIRRYLGGGGNAEVWEASRDDGTLAALKLLYQTNAHSEPYRRFRAEAEVLRTLGSFPGVLPVIDYHLPEDPAKGNPAYLALPLATNVREALGDDPPLREVVAAVRAYADTLAKLQTDYNIHHRDIKPENLYRHQDSWCL